MRWISTPRGARLAGELREGGADAVVVMAHGFCGDRHSRGRFDLVADNVARLGYAVLSFDFGGCGESDDGVVRAEHELEDLRAAMRSARNAGYQRLALYGHSRGSTICLRAYDADVQTMVLTGAATDAMHHDWTEHYTAAQLAELAATGRMRDGRVELDAQSLLDFEQVDQATLLGPVECPVLIVHGGDPDDAEEQQLLAHSRRAMALLPPLSRLTVVGGAGHTFEPGIHEVSALATDWLTTHLPLP